MLLELTRLFHYLKKKWLKRKDDRNGRPKLRLTTVFVKGTTTAFVKAYTTQLLQVPPQHLLKPDHKRWERLTTAFVKGTTTVCLKGRPQHYLQSHIFILFDVRVLLYWST